MFISRIKSDTSEDTESLRLRLRHFLIRSNHYRVRFVLEKLEDEKNMATESAYVLGKVRQTDYTIKSGRYVIPHEIDKIKPSVFLPDKPKQKYHNEASATRVLDNHSISYAVAASRSHNVLVPSRKRKKS